MHEPSNVRKALDSTSSTRCQRLDRTAVTAYHSMTSCERCKSRMQITSAVQSLHDCFARWPTVSPFGLGASLREDPLFVVGAAFMPSLASIYAASAYFVLSTYAEDAANCQLELFFKIPPVGRRSQWQHAEMVLLSCPGNLLRSPQRQEVQAMWHRGRSTRLTRLCWQPCFCV